MLLLLSLHLVYQIRLVSKLRCTFRLSLGGFCFSVLKEGLAEGFLFLGLHRGSVLSTVKLRAQLSIEILPHAVFLPLPRQFALRVHHVHPSQMLFFIARLSGLLLCSLFSQRFSLSLFVSLVASLLGGPGLFHPPRLSFDANAFVLKVLTHFAPKFLLFALPVRLHLFLHGIGLCSHAHPGSLLVVFSLFRRGHLFAELLGAPKFDFGGFSGLLEQSVPCFEGANVHLLL
mmetsp:Transcript_89886/g.187911  ORF Transcript_89886/g.187911 Transcript_89886/m.187911 type:complete len:230 (+) Transcript_89886:475-1164(+)